MKAAAFDYVRATSLAHALDLLAQHEDTAKLVSGGQSLMPALNLRFMAPELLIDISGLSDLKGVTVQNGVVRIGAMTRHVELQTSPVIAAEVPLLNQAINHVAHPAIRNRGTIGGNLCHADPASELPACVLALGGTMIVAGPGGERRIAASDFFTGIYETALHANEMLIAVEVPAIKPGQRDWFSELARRSGDYAIVGLTCRATLDGTTISDIQLGYFAVGDRAMLAPHASAKLVGRPVTAATIAEAQAALAHDLEPQDDPQASGEMRLHLARVLLGRCIADLTGVTSTMRKTI